MMKDLTGQRFGRLTVIGFDEKMEYNGNRYYYWKCRCDCGNEVSVNVDSLKMGNTRSCGCLKREACRENIKKAQKARNGKKYECDGEWHTISEWAEIAGTKYEAIRRRIQRGTPLNKPVMIGGNRVDYSKLKKLTVDGHEYTLRELSEKYRIPYQTIYARQKLGMPIEDILSTKPLDKRKGRRYNK